MTVAILAVAKEPLPRWDCRLAKTFVRFLHYDCLRRFRHPLISLQIKSHGFLGKARGLIRSGNKKSHGLRIAPVAGLKSLDFSHLERGAIRQGTAGVPPATLVRMKKLYSLIIERLQQGLFHCSIIGKNVKPPGEKDRARGVKPRALSLLEPATGL
jgi:hypothetical protein